MKNKHLLCCTISCVLSLLCYPGYAEIKNSEAKQAFLEKMSSQHHFDRQELAELFKSVEIKESILKAISAPAEGMPWYKYRPIFLTDAQINGGVAFWKNNQETLQKVAKEYGVPAEIIVAIIGVETRYGANTGRYRVIDALATLGFGYPKRSKFFLSELEHFLLLSREESMQALQLTGSYAGAMGIPQFMPSSFRTYAVDFEGDGRRDIWNNPADAIASVANYFVKHHWQTGEPVAFPASVRGDAYLTALTKGLKPDTNIGDLASLQVTSKQKLPPDQTVKLLAFSLQEGEEFWLALPNFYVITRYNHSPLYTMAVYQLSQAIMAKKNAPAE